MEHGCRKTSNDASRNVWTVTGSVWRQFSTVYNRAASMQRQNILYFYSTAQSSARRVRTLCCVDRICISARARCAPRFVRVARRAATRSAANKWRPVPKHAAAVRNRARGWRHKRRIQSELMIGKSKEELCLEVAQRKPIKTQRNFITATVNGIPIGPSNTGLETLRFAASFSFRRQLATTFGL